MKKTAFSIGSGVLFIFSFLIFPPVAFAQAESNPTPVLQIKADQPVGKVSPTLYGLMTEEINYSYEGGLYAELIANRTFNTAPNEMKFWNACGGATMSLDTGVPLNDTLNSSMKLDASNAGNDSPAGIVNSGYWGIPDPARYDLPRFILREVHKRLYRPAERAPGKRRWKNDFRNCPGGRHHRRLAEIRHHAHDKKSKALKGQRI